MIYHYVITVSVCLPRRWWQHRVRRSFHTASGHVRAPGPHTERSIYDQILAAVARQAGVDSTRVIVLCYRLAPELSSLDPVRSDLDEQNWPAYLDEDHR